MEELEGTVLAGESFEAISGRVVVDSGEIVAVEEAETASSDIVLPAFVNAHTHLGDSVAKEAGVGLSLEEAVAPPNSLKHRRLAAADRDELVTVDPVIFGSGDRSVLDVADGYGASGAKDGDFTDQRAAASERGVPFAIHAGEPDPTDIDPALDLDPDLLVHMVHATRDHLERVAEQSVPVAVCPRANTVLDVGRPPIRRLLDHTTVALGSDNVMLNPPSMFREMAYTARQFDVTAREVLRMATAAGAEIADLDCGVVAPGRRAALTVLDGDSDNLTGSVDPVQTVVRRATALDVERVVC